MEIYSHRGIGLGKENSKASILEAKRRGIKYETDIRRSKDGKLVLWHDRGYVEGKPYSELKKEGIVLLEDALQMGVDFDLDIKESAKGADVLSMVEQHQMMERVIFTSFFPDKVLEIKRKNKEATVGIITQVKVPKFILPFMAKAGMNYVLPHADTVTKFFVEKAHQCGLKVVTWCKSDEESNQSNKVDGVDGMIINNNAE